VLGEDEYLNVFRLAGHAIEHEYQRDTQYTWVMHRRYVIKFETDTDAALFKLTYNDFIQTANPNR
jgi:hypothetical protein